MRRTLLFVLLAALVAAIVNPGNFGTIDTPRRLQVARWIRLGEPQVRPDDHEFGLVNNSGVKQAWYGIGQSLVLVPFDFAVSAAVLPMARRVAPDPVKEEQIVELLIAFLMQWFLAACSLVLAYEVLIRFGFARPAAIAGALALLLATTCLFYVQSAQENNLLLLMSLTSLYGILRFRQQPDTRWAALAGAACGLALLTRLPSLLETAVFFAFAISIGCNSRQFLKGYLPPVAVACAIDRWYQWRRFGSPFHTYARELGEQLRRPSDPASFPFSYPFWKGFWGTLFSPDKSIFLFDPLLVVLILVLLWKWRSVERSVRLAILWLSTLLLLYIVIYARYFDFGGDVAWAHRFVTVPVELLALFAVPMLLSFAASLTRPARYAAWTLVCLSVVLQAASTTLAPNVEFEQKDKGYGKAVIVNRALNLLEVAHDPETSPRFAGVPREWKTLYYLPFQLRFRFPQFSNWAIALWCALLMSLPLVVWKLSGAGS